MRRYILTFLLMCLCGALAGAQEYDPEIMLRTLFTEDGIEVIRDMPEEDRNAIISLVYQRNDMQKSLAEYRREIEDFENRVNKLRQKDSLSVFLDAEMAANDSLEQRLRIAGKTIARLQRDSLEHEAYLAEFRPFVREYTKKTLMSQRGLLSGLYSQMTQSGLESLRNGLLPFANEEEGQVASFIREIDSVLVYKRLYDHADSLLRRPLDAAAVYETREELMQLKDVMPEDQFKEFDELDISLSRYKRTVEIFSEFLKDVEDDFLMQEHLKAVFDGAVDSPAARSTAANGAAYQAKKIASKHITDDVQANRLSRIPYMKEIYDTYMTLMTPENLLDKEKRPNPETQAKLEAVNQVVAEMLEQSKML